MREFLILLYFIFADTFGIDWRNKLQPIIKKYGCVVNALRRYRILWLYDMFFFPSCWIHRIYFKIHMWGRKHILHNL